MSCFLFHVSVIQFTSLQETLHYMHLPSADFSSLLRVLPPFWLGTTDMLSRRCSKARPCMHLSAKNQFDAAICRNQVDAAISEAQCLV